MARLASSSDVKELGPGILFKVQKDGRIWPAFVIRYQGTVYAYLNVCAHVGLRLNGDKDEVFNSDGTLLVCRSHGAMFDPESGDCTFGPCLGYGLIKLSITERDGRIIYEDTDYQLIPA